MRKQTKSLLLISLIICSLAIVCTTQLGDAQGGTQVGGIISTNTTWTKVNSPYTLSGAVGVPQGVTLQVEAGAVVNLATYYIEVNGTLCMNGESTNEIQINGGEIKFNPSCVNWSEQTGIGCVIENSHLNRTSITIKYCSVKIQNNEFRENGLGLSDDTSLILNNTFLISNKGSGSSIGTTNSNATITSNKFAGGYAALEIGSGTPIIENNLIIASSFGIKLSNMFNSNALTAIIRNNTISQNNAGIYFENMGGSLISPNIIYNNIFNNTRNVDLSGSGFGLRTNLIMTYNWWGTTNQQSINETIFDHKNDYNLGSVEFTHYLLETNLKAPAIPTFTIQAIVNPGGTIDPVGNLNVCFGNTLEFTLTPNDGYKLSAVTVDGVLVPSTLFGYPFPWGSSNKVYYTIEPVISNHIIQASFESLTATTSPTPAVTSPPSPSPSTQPTLAPTTNPTTLPTQSPTTNPTISPTQTITSSPTPTPTVPELSTILLLPMFALVIFGAVAIKQKRKLTKK